MYQQIPVNIDTEILMKVYKPGRHFIFLISALIAGIISGCSGQTIQPDFDKSTDFSRYTRFVWKSDMPNKETHAKNPFVHTAVLGDIGQALQSKKMVKANNIKDAELIVDYQMSVQRKLTGSNSSISFGTGSYSRGSSVGVGVAMPLGGADYEYEITFIISMTDKLKNKIIWRAVGADTIGYGPSDNRFKNKLRDLAKKIIAEYPPKQ